MPDDRTIIALLSPETLKPPLKLEQGTSPELIARIYEAAAIMQLGSKTSTLEKSDIEKIPKDRLDKIEKIRGSSRENKDRLLDALKKGTYKLGGAELDSSPRITPG